MHLLILSLALAADPQPQRVEWKVGDLTREALVVAPAKPTEHPPVVFAFHGHGGTMQGAVKSFKLAGVWPEAVAVHMQGLPCPSPVDPEGKRSGWAINPGDLDDRDLKFFDAVLAPVKQKYGIDEKRIYATGHSNGARFTYLLLAQRPEVFAAFAPVAAPAGKVTLKPAPVFHVAGQNDKTAPFDLQMKTIEEMKVVNGCEKAGTEWDKLCTLYTSKTGTPLVTMIHPGGHAVPAEAPALIVKFFKEHARKP
jgi:polyhydroxybutyrate depolymerase